MLEVRLGHMGRAGMGNRPHHSTLARRNRGPPGTFSLQPRRRPAPDFRGSQDKADIEKRWATGYKGQAQEAEQVEASVEQTPSTMGNG